MSHDRRPSNFNRFPILWLAVAFASGILLAQILTFDFSSSFILIVITSGASFIFRGRSFGTVLALIAFAGAGAFSSIIETQSVSANRLKTLYDNGTLASGAPVEIEGVLLAGPEPAVDSSILSLRAEKLFLRGRQIEVSGNVRLYLPITDQLENETHNPDLKYGSRLRIACRLKREDEYLNPGVMPKKEMLDRMGIDATGTIKSKLLIETIADESVFIPLAWVYQQRARLIEDFRNNLSVRAGGVMIASLLGDRNFLDKDTADLFRDGGTFHILVISGLHITFIGGLLILTIRQITKNRWIQFLSTTTILWAYTMAVGADIPVVRAAIMFTIMLFSYVIYRQRSLLNSLGLCGLILLVWRPSDVLNPSFQLTFVSVGAIVTIAFPLIESLRKIGGWMPAPESPFPPNVSPALKRFCETIYWSEHKWKFESKRQIWSASIFKNPFLANRITGATQKSLRWIFEGLLVSFIVQICMLPLSVVYFHRVSIGGIFLNLWVSLFIVLESFSAVLGAFAGRFSSLFATSLYFIAEIFNWLMLLIPRLFTDLGALSFRLPAYSGFGSLVYFLYFLPVVFIAVTINHWNPFEIKPQSGNSRKRLIALTAGLMSVLVLTIVFHPFSAPVADGRLRIDFLDVGQGDAALITFPDGKTLLVDGGGRIVFRNDSDDSEAFERDIRGIGESVVSEFLWHQGYSRIDYILATHADADHIQGLVDVAKNFKIGAAIFGRTPADDPEFAELATVLNKRSVSIETVSRGDRFMLGGAMVEVLYPQFSEDSKAPSDNDNSIVLRIVYKNRAFLLTGDIEKRAETDLVNGGGTLKADVIKVPHHGSRTSSTQEFTDSVGAKYAIIPVGRSSRFGHPHSEVVDRWNAAGATVLTTGERGTISFSTDGNDLKITTFQQ